MSAEMGLLKELVAPPETPQAVFALSCETRCRPGIALHEIRGSLRLDLGERLPAFAQDQDRDDDCNRRVDPPNSPDVESDQSHQ